MKILITEVQMDAYKTVWNITLNDSNLIVWEDGLKKYEVSDYIIEVLKDQGVLGWVAGVDGYNKPVMRTYMLVPE